MNGEKNLKTLLRTLHPELAEETFIYATVQDGDDARLKAVRPFATIREAEGLTIIVPEADARNAGFECHAPFRCITLRVHSSLHAVGLTAAVAATLAQHGISANMLAAYYHDHILVPAHQASEAMAQLKRLSEANQTS